MRNHQRQGLPLSDDIILERARFFATTVGSSDVHIKLNSARWLERFKRKNRLLGAKPLPKSEKGEDSDSDSDYSDTEIQTPNGISPISPLGAALNSLDLPSRSSTIKSELVDGYTQTPSQSVASLASQRSDTTTPSTFSQSPSTSSMYSPDGITEASSFLDSQQGANSIRPRSQTFPMLGVETSLGPSSGPNGIHVTPKQLEEIMSNAALETPVEEKSEAELKYQKQSRSNSRVHSPSTTSSPTLMGPPRHRSQNASPVSNSSASSPIGFPSQDEARKALELVMNFFQNQPTGAVDPQEYITMGKLMEKLKVHGTPSGLPGGMHSINMKHEVSRKRSIHSL